jgi:hypothetical protein
VGIVSVIYYSRETNKDYECLLKNPKPNFILSKELGWRPFKKNTGTPFLVGLAL